MPKWRLMEPLEGDPEEFKLQVGCTMTDSQEHFKFLGVVLDNSDNSLSWNMYTETEVKKASLAVPTLVALRHTLFGYSYYARRIII